MDRRVCAAGFLLLPRSRSCVRFSYDCVTSLQTMHFTGIRRMDFFVWLPAWAFLGFIGVLIAQSKGKSGMSGCLWGVLLGPIGWLILAMQPSEHPAMKPSEHPALTIPSYRPTLPPDARPTRKCPFCAEMILGEAIVCKHCGRDVEPLAEVDLPPAPVQALDGVESPERYKCPQCKERTPRSALFCTICGYQTVPVTVPPDQLAIQKICATYGKLITWPEALHRVDGIQYHLPCVPKSANADEGSN